MLGDLNQHLASPGKKLMSPAFVDEIHMDTTRTKHDSSTYNHPDEPRVPCGLFQPISSYHIHLDTISHTAGLGDFDKGTQNQKLKTSQCYTTHNNQFQPRHHNP